MSICPYVNMSTCQYVNMSICQYVRMQLFSLVIKMKVVQNVKTISENIMSVCQHVSMSICQNATFQLRYQNESCSECHQDVRHSFFQHVNMSTCKYINMSICQKAIEPKFSQSQFWLRAVGSKVSTDSAHLKNWLQAEGQIKKLTPKVADFNCRPISKVSVVPQLTP